MQAEKLNYSQPKQNYKGLWVCEVTKSNGDWVGTKTYTTKKRLLEWIKIEKLLNAKKVCMICGNVNQREIEKQILHSDGDGNDVEEITYICKEGKGCC